MGILALLIFSHIIQDRRTDITIMLEFMFNVTISTDQTIHLIITGHTHLKLQETLLIVILNTIRLSMDAK